MDLGVKRSVRHLAVALSLAVMELDAHLPRKDPTMLLPIAGPDLFPARWPDKGPGREAEVTTEALRQNYRDAVRLAAREEILADLAEDEVTARLHADTARFHHGAALAYAKALDLLVGDGPNVAEDKQAAGTATRETDLTPMRCQGRGYRAFDPDRL